MESKRPTRAADRWYVRKPLKETLGSNFGEINPTHNWKGLFKNLKQDILAGVTVAVIALPLALAFGVGSGLGASAGLWAAIIAGVFGGLFGGSSVGVSGPTGPLMVQVGVIMAGASLLPDQADRVLYTISTITLSGLFLMAISFLNIAQLVYYTPYSVVAGFMCGIGALVSILQLPHIFGVEAQKSVFASIRVVIENSDAWNRPSIQIAGLTFFTVVVWDLAGKKWSLLKSLPAPLLGLSLGTMAFRSAGFDLPTIGSIPKTIPHLVLPDFTYFQFMIGPAMALAGLALIDSLLTCLVGDHLNGEHHSSTREAFGRGLTNTIAGLFGALPTATSTTITVANFRCGSKTVLSSVIHGLVLVAIIFVFGSIAETIPLACLAALLFKVGIDVIDYRIVPILGRLPFTDAWAFWGTLFITVFADLMIAMGVGVAFAAFRFVHEMGHLYSYKALTFNEQCRSGDEITEIMNKMIAILQPRGPLFFGAVEPLLRAYTAFDKHSYLIIDLHCVSHIDLSGAYVLEDIVDKAKKNGVEVFFGGGSPRIHQLIKQFKIIEHIGQECYFDTYEEALEMVQELQKRESFLAAI